MSLILEALRKSESERRQGVAPDLLQPELPPAPAGAPRVPRWAWLAPLVLALPLLWWWQRSRAPAADTAIATIGVEASAHPVTASARQPRLLPPVERLQPAPAAPIQEAPIQEAPIQEAPIQEAPIQATPREPAPADVVAAPAPAATAPAAGADPIALGALAPGQRKALPPLQLSMHLWNEDPSRRVAILDGRRVAVGDRVGAAVVAEIRRDGVLLDWNGTQVLVPLR